ncbi:hypothetical protein DL93DRAFT_2093604 [Clavulina sp. PMI_390]|nr:hypothetical protein DL93DRAFT_2093604 [Clavulina sp. PMI_390]
MIPTGRNSRAVKRFVKNVMERNPTYLELDAAYAYTDGKMVALFKEGNGTVKLSLYREIFASLPRFIRLLVASDEWWRDEHPHWSVLTGDSEAKTWFQTLRYVSSFCDSLLSFREDEQMQPVFKSWAQSGEGLLDLFEKRSYFTSTSHAVSVVDIRAQALSLLCPVIVFQTQCNQRQSKRILGRIVTFILALRAGFGGTTEDGPSMDFLVASATWINECISYHLSAPSDFRIDDARLVIGATWQEHIPPYFSLRGKTRSEIIERYDQLRFFQKLARSQMGLEEQHMPRFYKELFTADVLGHFASLLNDILPLLEAQQDTIMAGMAYHIIGSIRLMIVFSSASAGGPTCRAQYVAERISPSTVERFSIYAALAVSEPGNLDICPRLAYAESRCI